MINKAIKNNDKKKTDKKTKTKEKESSKEKEIKLDVSEGESSEGEESEGTGSKNSQEGTESEEEDFYQEIKEKAILFEDEKFNKEWNTTTLAYEEFQEYMEAFIDYAWSNKAT